jgi:hypothetical protein
MAVARPHPPASPHRPITSAASGAAPSRARRALRGAGRPARRVPRLCDRRRAPRARAPPPGSERRARTRTHPPRRTDSGAGRARCRCVGAHRHDEDELGVAGRAIGQVVGEQKAPAGAGGDGAPAVADRLQPREPRLPRGRGPRAGDESPPARSATPLTAHDATQRVVPSPERQNAPAAPSAGSYATVSVPAGEPSDDARRQIHSMRDQQPTKSAPHSCTNGCFSGSL